MRSQACGVELRAGKFDVVHVQEPPGAVLAWDACSFPDLPVVGTFHAYSTKAGPNRIANVLGAQRKFNQLHERIAVSEAAAWTGRRWYGGTYEIVPNGVDLAIGDGAGRDRGRGRAARGAVRRPCGGAQGAADFASRLRGPRRAHSLPADRDRGRPRRARAASARPGYRRTDRRARADQPGRALAGVSRCRRAVCPVARRRELRHGPDRGVRGRHARDRLRDRRLLRRRQRRARRDPGSPGRSPAPRRGASRAPPRAASTAGDVRARA